MINKRSVILLDEISWFAQYDKDFAGKLKIHSDTIYYAAPYFQKKTKNQEACQVDLLIVTKYNINICEMKFKKRIDISVIQEVRDKMIKLKTPSHYSIRPVLIYNGELHPSVKKEGFFNNIINLADFLKAR